ncbi:S8 family peptidase [Parabacteroides distasonis]|uniref:S8 family peptidase n=1 Tax=Parabacteroides distasonis TaxID=823 RepID=UPI0039B40978
MKTNNLIYLLVIVLLSSIHCDVNAQYYWSQNRKIALTPDSSHLVLNIEADLIRTPMLSSDYKGFNEISPNIIVKENKSNIFSENDFKAYESDPLVKRASPAYLVNGTDTLYVTNHILLKPKNGVSIDSILAGMNEIVEVVDQTKYGVYTLSVNQGFDVLTYANIIYENGLVDFCHPDFIMRITQFLNDPLYSEQYYLNNTGQLGGTWNIDINAPEVWSMTKGSSSIKVAVIDQGVAGHEDLGDRLLPGFTPGLANGNGAPVSNNPHGECCAGIIGASHNNLGIAGIAPLVKIVPVNIFYSQSSSNIAAAINYAWDDAEADVISNSWGGSVADAITSAINNARTNGRGGLGCVVVFAAGNSGSSVSFPATVNGVIAVGAVDKNGALYSYSARGSEINLVAPSGALDYTGDIRTLDLMGSAGLYPGNYLSTFGGTSASCPQVSGVAALLLSINPKLTEAEVRNILGHSARKIGSYSYSTVSGHPFGTWNANMGYGLLDAEAAVREVYPQISGDNLVPCTGNKTYTLNRNYKGNWTLGTSGLQIVSGGQNSNSITVRAISNPGGTMSGTIYANVVLPNGSSVSVAKTVSIGAPSITSVSGPDQVGAGGSASFTASPIFMEDEGNYQWMVSPNTASMSAYRYSNSVTFSAPGTYIVGCRSTSTCGTPGSYVIKTVSVTGYYYSVSTSSSTHMVNISKETQIQDQFSVMLETRPTYTLYNQSTGALVREGTFLREGDLLDFNTLPSGIYVLRLQIGNDTYETHKIVFK